MTLPKAWVAVDVEAHLLGPERDHVPHVDLIARPSPCECGATSSSEVELEGDVATVGADRGSADVGESSTTVAGDVVPVPAGLEVVQHHPLTGPVGFGHDEQGVAPCVVMPNGAQCACVLWSAVRVVETLERTGREVLPEDAGRVASWQEVRRLGEEQDVPAVGADPRLLTAVVRLPIRTVGDPRGRAYGGVRRGRHTGRDRAGEKRCDDRHARNGRVPRLLMSQLPTAQLPCSPLKMVRRARRPARSPVRVAMWLSSRSMAGSRTRARSSASVRTSFAPRARTRRRSTPSCGR